MLLLTIGGYAFANGTPQEVDTSLRSDLAYLLSFVGPEPAGVETFQADRISALVGFVTGAKNSRVRYHAGSFNGAVSAYHEFDIHRNLAHILHLTYNPDIPAVATMPASIRLSYWPRIDTPERSLPRLWEVLKTVKTPQFIRGIEHIVNSPDQHSGAYFEYDLYRTLILMKHEERSVLISLSRQKGVSDVGKKGIIVGPDDNWDYLYTGQDGVSYAGLGWVDSYMYDSYSVSFYVETDTAVPTVRFGVFKWLRAGWAGINLARPAHIFNGLNRFATGFKAILESPRLADAVAVSRVFADLKNLSVEEQRKIITEYLAEIEKTCRIEKRLPVDQVDALFKNGDYLKGLNRRERESLITLVCVKNLLGTKQNAELTVLLPESVVGD